MAIKPINNEERKWLDATYNRAIALALSIAQYKAYAAWIEDAPDNDERTKRYQYFVTDIVPQTMLTFKSADETIQACAAVCADLRHDNDGSAQRERLCMVGVHGNIMGYNKIKMTVQQIMEQEANLDVMTHMANEKATNTSKKPADHITDTFNRMMMNTFKDPDMLEVLNAFFGIHINRDNPMADAIHEDMED